MKTTVLFSLSLFLLCCKKEEAPTPKSITIGFFDEGYTYHEYVNPVKLEYTVADSVQNTLFGTDSIDIDLDGIVDIQLESKKQINSTGQFGYFFYNLLPVNDFEIEYFVASFYTPGHTFNEKYASRYELGNKLFHDKEKDNEQWGGTKISLWCWSTNFPVPTSPWGAEGMYQIGIRKKVDGIYKYGWMTLKFVSRYEIYFVNYALEK